LHITGAALHGGADKTQSFLPDGGSGGGKMFSQHFGEHLHQNLDHERVMFVLGAVRDVPSPQTFEDGNEFVRFSKVAMV
jgi:hypothetical protein